MVPNFLLKTTFRAFLNIVLIKSIICIWLKRIINILFSNHFIKIQNLVSKKNLNCYMKHLYFNPLAYETITLINNKTTVK